LTKKEIEEIEEIVKRNYGVEVNLKKILVLEGKEKKIRISNKNVLKLNLEKLGIDSIGLYFGKIKRNKKIHLSVEGSQMIGKNAVKNIVCLSKKNTEKFLKGENVKPQEEINCEYYNFVIVKFKKNILGSSLLVEEKLKNLLPKSRRTIY
jgi:NOL1/NOP2/fmu family ribosome biogenesis protein